MPTTGWPGIAVARPIRWRARSGQRPAGELFVLKEIAGLVEHGRGEFV
jgi:hypothetical protein